MINITLLEMESIWTILMFIVLVIMIIILIGHHFKMKSLQEDLEYEKENRMTNEKK